MAKRSPRGAKPTRKKQQESKPMAPLERHSGEGSASALEMLQRMEDRRRLPARPDKDDPEA